MKNSNKKFKNIFDSFFEDKFTDSFFSVNFSFPNFTLKEAEFPDDKDVNFNKTEEIIETENHSTKKETWTSIDGSQRYERTSMQSKQPSKTLKEPSSAKLKLLLDKAVEEQDFEEAIKLRDKLKEK